MTLLQSSTRFDKRMPLAKSIVSILFEVFKTIERYLLKKCTTGKGFGYMLLGRDFKRGVDATPTSVYNDFAPTNLGVGGAKTLIIEAKPQTTVYHSTRFSRKEPYVLFFMDLLEQSFRNAIFEQSLSTQDKLFEFQAQVLSNLNLLILEAQLLEKFGEFDSDSSLSEEAT